MLLFACMHTYIRVHVYVYKACVVWYGTVRYGMVWCVVLGYDMLCCVMLLYIYIYIFIIIIINIIINIIIDKIMIILLTNRQHNGILIIVTYCDMHVRPQAAPLHSLCGGKMQLPICHPYLSGGRLCTLIGVPWRGSALAPSAQGDLY